MERRTPKRSNHLATAFALGSGLVGLGIVLLYASAVVGNRHETSLGTVGFYILYPGTAAVTATVPKESISTFAAVLVFTEFIAVNLVSATLAFWAVIKLVWFIRNRQASKQPTAA